VKREKPENPEKNPRSKDENQQQTQTTYDSGPELNRGHIGGKRALRRLRHSCSPGIGTVPMSLKSAIIKSSHICFNKEKMVC